MANLIYIQQVPPTHVRRPPPNRSASPLPKILQPVPLLHDLRRAQRLEPRAHLRVRAPRMPLERAPPRRRRERRPVNAMHTVSSRRRGTRMDATHRHARQYIALPRVSYRSGRWLIPSLLLLLLLLVLCAAATTSSLRLRFRGGAGVRGVAPGLGLGLKAALPLASVLRRVFVGPEMRGGGGGGVAGLSSRAGASALLKSSGNLIGWGATGAGADTGGSEGGVPGALEGRGGGSAVRWWAAVLAAVLPGVEDRGEARGGAVSAARASRGLARASGGPIVWRRGIDGRGTEDAVAGLCVGVAAVSGGSCGRGSASGECRVAGEGGWTMEEMETAGESEGEGAGEPEEDRGRGGARRPSPASIPSIVASRSAVVSALVVALPVAGWGI
ncbi:hypothetical protein B0H15DRAFT_870417 [Mycena belliarum]|uniref:Uncharacterized protein n=1 Tax=Mycena belliarum TaxID=1033014 RepID=A0AAD6XIC8_9AGAR|nr:hypothetical protein B0H15DRAFT_870417 [Mycena belliae]